MKCAQPASDRLIAKMVYTHSKLFWIWNVFTRRAFWDHCQQNWGIFTCLIPVDPKVLISDLFFNNYETVRRRYVKLYFFWIVITSRICWYGFWQYWRNFWIWPLYKLSCDPRLPVQDVTRQQYDIGDPWTHANIIKITHYYTFSNLIIYQS